MTEQSYEIRGLDTGEVDAYLAHCRVHESQADQPGELPRGPYPRHPKRSIEELRQRAQERLSKRLDEPGWRRLWGLSSGERVVGHVSLTGPELPSMLHRAELGIGIEIEHRGKGWGARLMQTALAWARDQPKLDWVDLGVFAGNTAALRLYENLGFKECGKVRDSFRVNGVSIDDIRMTLWVGARGTDELAPP